MGELGVKETVLFLYPNFLFYCGGITISLSMFAKTLNPKGKQGLRRAGGLPGWGKGGTVSEGTESLQFVPGFGREGDTRPMGGKCILNAIKFF